MSQADLSIRIARLHELKKFLFLFKAAEDDIYDPDLIRLDKELLELEERLAALVQNVERLEDRLHGLMDERGVVLDFDEPSEPQQN